MEKKLSIIIALTTGVFIFTVVLFLVVILDSNLAPEYYPSSATAISSNVPQQQEIDHPGQKIFKANCTPCHRIHQKLIGPPLAGVLERRDSLWVVKMIRNSSQLIASGDPIAGKLFREYNGIQMTSFTSMSDEQLRHLLEYIKLEGDKQISVPAPSQNILSSAEGP